MLEPSDWVRRWTHLIPPGGRVLDLACGSGRHARFLAARGHEVVAADRNTAALGTMKGLAGIATLQCDLESQPWPFRIRDFDAIVVAGYLHRPLMPRILESLARGGVLIYETFAEGNELYGRPTNPEFLLKRGELLDLVRAALEVVAFEEGFVAEPRPAVVSRICAVKSPAPARLLPPDD